MSVCLSVAYIGPKSRTERPRKAKIGTEVAHVTRDSDTTFKVRRSKVNLFDGQKRHSLRPADKVTTARPPCALLCFDSVGTNLVKWHSAYYFVLLLLFLLANSVHKL